MLKETCGITNILEEIAKTNLKNAKQVYTNSLRLESFILKCTPQELNQITESLKETPLLRQLQQVYEEFEINLETEYAKQIINGKETTLNNYLLYKRFSGLIRNEINLAKIKKDDNVLFIGSGPLPISAILFNSLVKCRVDCYEKDGNRAKLSQNALSFLGISEKIRVITKNAGSLDKNNYTVVVVALLAKPKFTILNRIFERVGLGTRIICRTSDGVRKAFYEETNPNLFKRFKAVRKVTASGDQTISSVLLVR